MLLRGFSLPVEYLSASSLAKAATCPEQWRRKYLLREPEKVYYEMFLGNVVHAAAEENWFYKMGTGKNLDLRELGIEYEKLWDRQLEKSPPDWMDKDPDQILETGLNMIVAYHEAVADKVTPVKVEERFEESIEGVPVPIIGYMDVVTPDRVIDQKTSKKRVREANANWRFQARVYELVADLPTEWHVVTNQAEPKVYTAEEEPGLYMSKGNADATITMIKQITERLNDFYTRYGPDNPWPTDGVFHPWVCGRCFAKNNGCPAWTPRQKES
jgi:PD-(D/E)XK nuclease superfamily